MASVRRFSCHDMFLFGEVNLDNYTETYHLPFYLQYLAQWPEYCLLATGRDGRPRGYIFGKAEGEGRSWHGHVTALTVAPLYRRQGLAQRLMAMLEQITERQHNGYFVDLFVRASNALAIGMYGGMGYTTYRRVLGYYSGQEDALDMRKAMPRDVNGDSVVPRRKAVRPWELEYD